MKTKTLAYVKYALILVIMVLAVSQTATAQKDDPGQERSLVGVWRVTFTPYNCVTGDPIPVAIFQALFTFHEDGTMSVWSQNNVITVTRTPGHGLWQREKGWSEYSTKFILLQYNLATGAYSARQEARGTLTLGESGNEYTATSATTVFFANGNPPATGCSTAVGTRFE